MIYEMGVEKDVAIDYNKALSHYEKAAKSKDG